VKLLLEKGANIEAKHWLYRVTPLIYAAEKRHEAIVRLLLEKGAVTDFDHTPYYYYDSYRRKAIEELLREKQADIEMQKRANIRANRAVRAPLWWLRRKKKHEAVVKLR
jgi:ankyrin repeat protein